MKTQMSTLDLMLDLETLGNGGKPVLIQLAAVPFRIETGEILPETFDMMINPQSGVKAGMEIDGSTMEWWLKQDKAVYNKIVVKAMTEGLDLNEVLTKFEEYIQMLKKTYNVKVIKVYTNGMDGAWLQSNYTAVHKNLPVPFWDLSDIRMTVDLGRRLFGIDPKKDMPFVGKAHDALDDCRHQIKYVSAIVTRMKQQV